MRKVFLVFVLFFSAVLLSGCKPKPFSGQAIPEEQPTPVPTRPIEQAIKERPYVALLPSSDNHWLNLEVKNIPKGSTGLEYELIYFAEVEGSRIERGVSTLGSPVDLNKADEFSKKILLGSASCTTGTCKYKYDEGVNEGTLTLKLNGSSGIEKFDTAFRIQKGKEGKEGLSVGDGVFSFVSTNLPPTGVYLTISCIGVPVALPGGVAAKTVPDAIFSSSGTVKGGVVAFKTSLSNVSIYAFDGKSWSKLATEVNSGEAKATASGQNIFILTE